MTVSITTFCIKCHHDGCHCAECRDIFIIMLSDVMLNVVMLSVVAPFTQFGKNSVNAGYVQSIRDVSNDVFI